MKVLVLGSSGQLARHLRSRMPEATFWGRDTVSVADTENLERQILQFAPAAIINAAAYTAVDRAETDAALAWKINAEATAAAARAAAILGAVLIHVSTDYVFDGESHDPYSPDSPTRPTNVYGKTKLAGELAAATLCHRHWILRSSWVFSEFDGNFVTTMLRLGAERGSIRVVDDQYGRPTYAGHLAEAMIRLISEPRGLAWGIHHAVGGPVVTWYGFAQRIFQEAKALGVVTEAPEVLPIPTSQFPTAAKRPLRAVLAPSRELQHPTNSDMDWRQGLQNALIGATR